MNKPILVPTDLTDVALKAIRQAEIIAKKAGTSVALLHVLNDKSPSLIEVEDQLTRAAAEVKEATGKECEILIKEGSIYEIIPQASCDHGYDLMVIGTHGVHGIRQHFLGADILKLVNKVCIPALVVQKHSPLIENFRLMVMPVSSHTDFKKEINAALLFTGLYNTEIHLYSIYKPGYEWPEQLLKNIEEATKTFESNGIRMKRVKEDQSVFSQGYAKQTIMYASSVRADMISIMSAHTEDYHYFASADKEMLMLNEHFLPVLCA
ncbi:MAG: universal stress protein [Bacteroidetes bacterium]|nr:universal stress protein [Bacteroidota bacterium]